ncbi:cytidine deaminase [Varunaivibrio sulfuroxidans]|uniref:Cytidine deaminase n=1 Tax=Varunaivibrio sulfuroxidans TaxID=1773489 RepID=A0A4V2UNZ4_9PROT|nr:cytidine deaminase [Varunaivibrio sulfuroxidans]TCS63981.1 cytidine deaminase [Varunaivibrio sulfuroxidans]WES31566.1 cytidine deaminase [Varunaivibrio sulfuroxidans]
MAMDDAMREALDRAVERSYAPYSRFAVGAVVRGKNGRLYGGCNVENAAYPEGSCAETAAIAAMVMDGEREIVEIAVRGRGDTPVTPCGGCRQRIREFASAATPIHLCGAGGVIKTVTLDDLLPMSFGPDTLADGGEDAPARGNPS